MLKIDSGLKGESSQIYIHFSLGIFKENLTILYL